MSSYNSKRIEKIKQYTNDVNNSEQDANKNDSGYKIEDNVLIIDMH